MRAGGSFPVQARRRCSRGRHQVGAAACPGHRLPTHRRLAAREGLARRHRLEGLCRAASHGLGQRRTRTRHLRQGHGRWHPATASTSRPRPRTSPTSPSITPPWTNRPTSSARAPGPRGIRRPRRAAALPAARRSAARTTIGGSVLGSPRADGRCRSGAPRRRRTAWPGRRGHGAPAARRRRRRRCPDLPGVQGAGPTLAPGAGAPTHRRQRHRSRRARAVVRDEESAPSTRCRRCTTRWAG